MDEPFKYERTVRDRLLQIECYCADYGVTADQLLDIWRAGVEVVCQNENPPAWVERARQWAANQRSSAGN